MVNQEASSEETVDSSHVLLLSSPDHTLSTYPLQGDNYNHWKRACEVSFTTSNKLSIMDGTYAEPAAESSLLPHWKRCNSMVISWILHSVSKEISESILYCSTAKDMWNELAMRLGQSQGP